MTTRRHIRGNHRVHRTSRTLTLRHGDDLKKRPTRVPTTRCLYGKRRHFTKEDAEMALACIDRSNPRRREQRVYQCPACHDWHLTSQTLDEFRASRPTKPQTVLSVAPAHTPPETTRIYRAREVTETALNDPPAHPPDQKDAR